jgi:hypothetical protein
VLGEANPNSTDDGQEGQTDDGQEGQTDDGDQGQTDDGLYVASSLDGLEGLGVVAEDSSD